MAFIGFYVILYIKGQLRHEYGLKRTLLYTALHYTTLLYPNLLSSPLLSSPLLSSHLLCSIISQDKGEKCTDSTLFEAPNSLVLVNVQHSTSLSSLLFFESVFFVPFRAVTAGAAEGGCVLGLSFEAAAA